MARRPPHSCGSSRPGSRGSGRRRLSTDPGVGATSGATEAAGPDVPEPAPARPAIDERAARRAALENQGIDRYDSLIRHLQAGHELPIQPRPKRTLGLDIHPSFGRLLLVALLIAIVWLAAIAVTDYLRQGRVDTWVGPDASVQSGLRLAGCPDVAFLEDVYFPSWVKFDGKVFRWADQLTPIGPNSVGRSYLDSGYTNGDLRLYLVQNSPDGRAGNLVMIRQAEAPAGAMYVVADCG